MSVDGIDIHTVDPTADLQSSRFYSLNRIRVVWSHYMSHQMLYLFTRLFIDSNQPYLEKRWGNFSDLSLSATPALVSCFSSLGHLLCWSFDSCRVFTHTGWWAGGSMSSIREGMVKRSEVKLSLVVHKPVWQASSIPGFSHTRPLEPLTSHTPALTHYSIHLQRGKACAVCACGVMHALGLQECVLVCVDEEVCVWSLRVCGLVPLKKLAALCPREEMTVICLDG